MPEIKNAAPVRAESLESFLRSEKNGLQKLLTVEEGWARKNLPDYAPRPDELAFKADLSPADIRAEFLRAIRVNPDVSLPLFIQPPPKGSCGQKQTLKYKDISIVKDDVTWNKIIFCALKEGEAVAPIDVIAAAANEPDQGLDIRLWQDSGTEFGLIYGFGRQSFGNPKLAYDTSAPFHMAFYYESEIINLLAPRIKRTYPEYRVYLYQALARFAFKTGHPYWGYRFMGWGLHYVQDLTQPYHATALPKENIFYLFWVNLMNELGFHKAMDDLIQLVSNRHLSFEVFQRDAIRRAYENHEENNPVLLALSQTKNDSSHKPFDNETIRTVLSREASAKADALAEAVVKWMPSHLVKDPAYNFDPAVREEYVYDDLLKNNKDAIPPLEDMIADLFESVGVQSRNYVHSIICDL